MALLPGVFNGSQVLMRSGEILPIELTSPGDEVISHAGSYSKIKERRSRRYSGTYLVIDTIDPFSTLRVTPSQMMLTLPFFQEKDPLRRNTVRWVAAGDLTIEDFILIPWAASAKNTKLTSWVRNDTKKLATVDKFVAALGLTQAVKNISVIEETDLVAHRLVLEGEGSFIASGAAVRV